MKLLRKVGVTSEIWQIFIQDSSSTTGAGLTGLTNASAGLTAYYHRDTDTTATAVTLATMTVGTFTSSGFKEIDATNMPGWYQFCPPNAALASGAKSCAFHLKGATNMAPLPIEVDLQGDVNVTHVAGTAQTARDIGASVLLSSGTGTGQVKLSAGYVAPNWGDVGNPTTSVNLSATTVNLVNTATAVTNQLTQAQIATGVWTDTTAGDFTMALSIGKSIMNGVTLGTGLTINAYTGNTVQTGDAFARIGAAGAGLTDLGGMSTAMKAQVNTEVDGALDTAIPVTPTADSINERIKTLDDNFTATVAARIDVAISGRMASYTQPTGFLAATFPTGTIANTTNITAGTVTTVTNLTNAPTSGDLTATMKASVNAEVVDALAIDTYAEPVQGAPAATTTLAVKINYLYKMLRNKKTQTSTERKLYADDGTTVDQKATDSDDGTTFTKGELGTGP